jgi:hypothetical protein
LETTGQCVNGNSTKTLVNVGPGNVFSSDLIKYKGPQSFEECYTHNC